MVGIRSPLVHRASHSVFVAVAKLSNLGHWLLQQPKNTFCHHNVYTKSPYSSILYWKVDHYLFWMIFNRFWTPEKILDSNCLTITMTKRLQSWAHLFTCSMGKWFISDLWYSPAVKRVRLLRFQLTSFICSCSWNFTGNQPAHAKGFSSFPTWWILTFVHCFHTVNHTSYPIHIASRMQRVHS